MVVEDLSYPGSRNVDSDEVIRTVSDGLTLHNTQMKPDPDAGPVTLVVHNEDGAVCAGLIGRTAWGWLRIDKVWVSDELRGTGLGKQLVERAERIAKDRGCRGAHLDTLEFQAPGFYSSLGYSAFGQLENYPDGPHQFFAKEL